MPLNFDDAAAFSGTEPEVKRQRTKISANLESVLKEEGAEHLGSVVDAIYGQESGRGANSRTSVDGARGGMQIIPGTFRRLAKPGESIDNPDDNLRVGVRYIKQLGDKFGNDPARIAAGYFSGEGNVSTAGDQPFKQDRSDGNGKRVSSYVQDVLGRVGDAVVPRAQAKEADLGQLSLFKGSGADDKLSQLSIFKDAPKAAAPGAAPVDDLELIGQKRKQAADPELPSREELVLREMLAGHTPEQLARVAAQGGLPGRVAQKVIEGGGEDKALLSMLRSSDSFKALADTHEYRALSASQKDVARQRYFLEKVAPALTEDKRPGAWKVFEQRTRPGLLERGEEAAKGVLERMVEPFGEDKRGQAIRNMFEGHTDAQLERISGQGGKAGRVADALLMERKRETEKPSMAKLLALENPLTAIAETAANVASQGIAMPVAGIAGLAAEAGKALGITEKDGADVVHQVADSLTYKPRGEMGQMAAEAVMWPFEKLAEAGQAAGGAVLDATGSPLAATAVDTAVNALPMVLGGKGKSKIGGLSADAHSEASLNLLAKAHPDKTTKALAEAELDARSRRPASEQATVRPEVEAGPIAEAATPAKADGEPISLEEARGVVDQSRAAGSDVPAGDGYAGAPRDWLSPDKVSAAEELQPQREAVQLSEVRPALPEESSLVREVQSARPESEGLPGSMPTAPKQLTERAGGDASLPVEAVPRAGEDGVMHQSVQSMAPGVNHVGLIDDAKLAPAGERRVEPLRREDILSDLAESLGVTIYQGRVKQKGVLGTYTPQKETVRIKKAADIEVAAHEVAHLLDDRIPMIREAYKGNKSFAKELRGVSYDKTKLHEGFAEFVRLYMTQPEQAMAKAPEFSKWFGEFVKNHEYGPAIEKAREGMTAWFNQGALDRARSKIGKNKEINEAFDRMSDRFRQSVIDDLHGIYRMERDLKGEVKPGGAYETARLSRASHSIAEGAINHGSPLRKADGSVTFSGRGLREILEPVSDKLEDTLLYFVGRASQELMMQGREHLFTKAEVRSMLDLRTPERAEAFRQYQEWNKGIVDFAEQLGVINPASRKMWQRQNYMPFHRVGQPDGFSVKPGAWSGVKALTGGTENLRSILGNMTSNAAMLIDKALKNEARQKIAKLAETERGAGKFMTKIDSESRPVNVDKGQVLKAVLKSMGIDKADPSMARLIKDLETQIEASPGMFELMVHNQAPAGGNVVAVLNQGKPTYYEVADPVLYRALSAIDRPSQSWLVKVLGLPKRIGQTATTLTPDFMVANIARDTLMGAVMSRAGFRPVMDSLEGMRLRVTNDPLYKEYLANGGGLSSIYLDESKLRARLEKFYHTQGIDYRTVLDAPDKLLGFVETLADAFETSTRLGEYKRARESGQHPRHAAYLAREVSTDFAMRGDNPAVNFMYDTVMFLKPAVLSFDRLGRGLLHDPNRAAIAAKAGMVALFSMGLALLNSEDERYQDLPDWDRDTHWHFFAGDQHFRYPKIWEVGAMASAAERAMEATIKGDPSGLGGDLARIVGQTFGLNLMPQILAPIYEQATNRNSFTKAMIETPGMESLQPFMRAKTNTSHTLQAAGMATRDLPESMQINPVRTEALLRGYLSTWALYGLMLSDKAFFSDQVPAGRTDQMPVVRRFYSEEPAMHTKYEQQYYDMLGESRRLFGTMRELYKDGSQDLAQEYRDDPKMKNYGALEGASKVLQMINTKMRAIRRDDSLDPEGKREALDEWTLKRNEVLKRTVGAITD